MHGIDKRHGHFVRAALAAIGMCRDVTRGQHSTVEHKLMRYADRLIIDVPNVRNAH